MQEQDTKSIFSEEERKHLSDFFLLLFKIFQRVRKENQETSKEPTGIESDK